MTEDEYVVTCDFCNYNSGSHQRPDASDDSKLLLENRQGGVKLWGLGFILLNLQADKRACCCFMAARRRHAIPGSVT